MDIDKLAAEQSPEPTEGNSRYNEVWTFHIEHEHAGEKLVGSFKNRIINNNDRLKIGNTAARMREGVPYESIDPATREFQQALAHLIVSLDAERPVWAKTLGSLKDDNVIWAIYTEVVSHEATFRGPRPDPKAHKEDQRKQDGKSGELVAGQAGAAAAVG